MQFMEATEQFTEYMHRKMNQYQAPVSVLDIFSHLLTGVIMTNTYCNYKLNNRHMDWISSVAYLLILRSRINVLYGISDLIAEEIQYSQDSNLK